MTVPGLIVALPAMDSILKASVRYTENLVRTSLETMAKSSITINRSQQFCASQIHGLPEEVKVPEKRVSIRKTPEAVRGTGSYVVVVEHFFHYEDIPGRRLRPEQVGQETAKKQAQDFARAEQEKTEEK